MKTHISFYIIVCLFACCITSSTFGVPVDKDAAITVGLTHLDGTQPSPKYATGLAAQSVTRTNEYSVRDVQVLTLNDSTTTLAYILQLSPEGYIVVSPDTDITPIIAYSFTGDFPLNDPNHPLLHMVTWDMGNRLGAIPITSKEVKVNNNVSWEKYLSANGTLVAQLAATQQWGPWVTTQWHQDSPYNKYCPCVNLQPGGGCSDRGVVGCTATAMAQIINYWQYPRSVEFNDSDRYVTTSLHIRIDQDANTRDFPNFASLNQMLKHIDYAGDEDETAALCFACGISVAMDYNYNPVTGASSGAHASEESFKNKFKYGSAQKKESSDNDFYDVLSENMENGQPALITIYQNVAGAKQGYHSIVVDGLMDTGEYHLNFGWGSGNPSNPWYSLPQGMPMGYDTVDYGILDIRPPNVAYIYSTWGGWTMQDEIDYLTSIAPHKYDFVWYDESNIDDLWSNLNTHNILLIDEDTFYTDGDWSELGGPIYNSFRSHASELGSFVENGGAIFTTGENDLYKSQVWDWLPPGMQATSYDPEQTSDVHIVYDPGAPNGLYSYPNTIADSYLSQGHTHAWFSSWDTGYTVTVRRNDNSEAMELFGVFGKGCIVVSHVEAESGEAWEYLQNQLTFIVPSASYTMDILSPSEGSSFAVGDTLAIRISIKDQFGNPVSGATVSATSPSGTPIPLYEILAPGTTKSLSATYSQMTISTGTGIYEGTYTILPTDSTGDWMIVIVASVGGEFPKQIIHTEILTNRSPVANAGPDQTVYAWIDGLAEVNLDGSGSYDEDGDELAYSWSWTIDGNDYEANGIKPTIELPVGQHIISLIVNDGTIDSEPNEVNITVVPPVEANLNVTPKVLNCRSNQPRIMATLRLPKGITRDQIDTNEPILLYPGEIEADKVWISRDFDYKCRAWSTTIFASFDKDELMDVIPNNGPVELAVVGQLKTGQYFYGTDNIRVICPGHWPRHRHWCNHRWERRCRGLCNSRH